MRRKIDYEEINRLINLLEEKNLSHFELEVEGLKVRISRNTTPQPAAIATQTMTPSPQTDMQMNLSAPEIQTNEQKNNLHILTSPMVGTFYRAPDPASAPFVDIGDPVKKKQILCIIEAMKLMNEIESDVEGVVKEIYVENGKPIEYGQKLFAIKTPS